MGLPDSDIVTAIYHLLPGFVSAWIFYALTAHPRTAPFERVIQALIFTMLTEAVVACAGRGLLLCGRYWTCGEFDSNAAYVWKVGVAILLGFLFASFANTNRFHSILPDWITKRTSFPSEWFSAFNGTKRYIYLNFTDGRRLFGWPEEWPDEPGKGHFVITQPEWILDDNSRIPLKAIERMLIPASLVELVEFEKQADQLVGLADQIKSDAALMIAYNAGSGPMAGQQGTNNDSEQ